MTAFIEAALIIGLLTLTDGMQEDAPFLPFLIIRFVMLRGLFCLDVSMVVLKILTNIFQQDSTLLVCSCHQMHVQFMQ